MKALIVIAMVAGTVLALTGCRSSQPSYCSDVGNLTNSVKDLKRSRAAG